MLAAILLVVLCALCVLSTYIFNGEYRRKLSKIKSEKALPLIGHVLKLGKTKEEFLPALERMWTKMGRDKFVLKIGPLQQVVLTKPEDVEVILTSNRQLNKSVLYKTLETLIGKGLATVDVEKWRPMRKILTSTFNLKFLDAYVDLFSLNNDLLIKQLTGDEIVNALPIFYNVAVNNICRIVIGYDDAYDMKEDKDFQEYIHYLDIVTSLTNDRLFSAWKSIPFLYNLTADGKEFNRNFNLLKSVTVNMINKKREDIKDLIEEVNSGRETLDSIVKEEKYNKRRLSSVELLLLARKVNGESYTNEEITAEVTTFVVAGHETAASVATFALHNLSLNPEVQENAFQEQISLTGGDLNKPIAFRDLQEMKYLECVIKETMRLYCPIIFFGRKITEDTFLPDGTVLPVGSNILFLPYFSHRDPEIYPDPEKFDPNRFLENPPSRYMFFPFSDGPRNCIGQKLGMLEVKYWLATILRSLELLPIEGQQLKLKVEFVLKPSPGLNVRCRKRYFVHK